MKKVEAYIRPDKLDDVKDALKAIDLNGISVYQIMGCGTQMGWTEIVRGSEVDYNFLPKIKIEVVVVDFQVEAVIETIIGAARTGEVGDGKIFISDVRDAVRIRTGERGATAVK